MSASRLRSLSPAVIAAGLGLLYAPVLAHAVDVWRLDQELSFGFLLPVVAVALSGLRWPALRSAAAAGAPTGAALWVVVAGLLLFVAGRRTGVSALAGTSLLPTVLGTAAYLYGTGAARVLFAPAAFMTAGLSLFRGLFASLGFALQDLTARLSAGLGAAAGLPVHRSGVDIFVGGAHFVIAQACSGLDSLLALLSLSLLVAALATASWPRRALLVALVIPVVLAANVLRVTTVLALSVPLGTASAEGLPHEAMSAAVFLFASLVMWSACAVLRCLPRFDATPSLAS